MTSMDWRRMIVVATVATACGFDSGGDGADTSGGTSSTGATDPATTDPATTDPVTTDPVTTDPATTDPATTDPTTTDPSTDPTTTDPTTDDDTTATDPSDGSSTDGDPGAYGPCDGNVCPDGQMCAFGQLDNVTVGTSCRPPCADVSDCPPPASGSPQIFCPTPNYPWCVLECADSTCPDGMDCVLTDFGEACHFPL
jgi:hypothetical protein